MKRLTQSIWLMVTFFINDSIFVQQEKNNGTTQCLIAAMISTKFLERLFIV